MPFNSGYGVDVGEITVGGFGSAASARVAPIAAKHNIIKLFFI
jgi:hypothetical protein